MRVTCDVRSEVRPRFNRAPSNIKYLPKKIDEGYGSCSNMVDLVRCQSSKQTFKPYYRCVRAHTRVGGPKMSIYRYMCAHLNTEM